MDLYKVASQTESVRYRLVNFEHLKVSNQLRIRHLVYFELDEGRAALVFLKNSKELVEVQLQVNASTKELTAGQINEKTINIPGSIIGICPSGSYYRSPGKIAPA